MSLGASAVPLRLQTAAHSTVPCRAAPAPCTRLRCRHHSEQCDERRVPDADVAGMSPVPAQMWRGGCGSPDVDAERAGRVPVQMCGRISAARIGPGFDGVSLWVHPYLRRDSRRYAEMEMRAAHVNHARNIWDRAVTLLPRVAQLWYHPRPVPSSTYPSPSPSHPPSAFPSLCLAQARRLYILVRHTPRCHGSRRLCS